MGRWNRAEMLDQRPFSALRTKKDSRLAQGHDHMMPSQSSSGSFTFPATITKQDTGSLARDLAAAYKHMAAFYHDQLDLSGPEADARARGLDYSDQGAAEDRARIMERPPDQVSWFDLNRLIERNPDDMIAVWAKIKAQAREELASGFRTAHALDWNSRPWQQARFLAIRASFRAGTPPRNGIESALLDTAAEAFGDYLELTEQFHMQISSEVETEQHRLEREGGWTPPRLSMAEAIEQSSKLAERAHTRFLRTVKMLHELRRLTPTVYVGNAGQINVGHQQVNVTAPASTEQTDLPK